MFGEGTGANFGGGTLDWGFLGAIAGRKNFDALKQEKLRELNLVQQQNAILENNVAQQQAAADGVSQYLDIVNNLKVLPEGLDRIKKIDADLRTNITKGILESNGDVKKWILSGGDRVLKEYQKNLVNNDVTQREIANAYQTNKWLADQQAGLQERWSGMNEDGTPITFDQQFKKYKNGEIDQLNYNGAFKLPEYNSTIPKRYAFEDKYKPKSATINDVYNDAFQQFKDLPLNDRQQAARHHAEIYRQQLQSGAAPYQFLHDQMSPVDYAKIENLKSSTRKNNAEVATLSELKNRLTEIQKGNVKIDGVQPFVDENGKPIDNGTGKPLGIPYITLDAKNNEHTLSLAGFDVDKDGMLKPQSMLQLKNMNLSSVTGGKIDLSNVPDASFMSAMPYDNHIYIKKDANGVTIPMRMITVKIDEKGGELAKYNGKLFEEENGFVANTNLPPLSTRDYSFNIRPFNYNDGVHTTNVLVPLKNNIFTGVEDFNKYSSKMKNDNMSNYTGDAFGELQDLHNQINIMQEDGE